MNKSVNFSMKVVIFIFFLIINQEQKALSIDTGSGLHFMSAISSDPKMQELIIKSFFITGTFLSCSISALIITALTKYIFFDKNNDKINALNKENQDLISKLASNNEESIKAIQESNKNTITSLTNNVELLDGKYSKSFDEAKKIYEEKIKQLNLEYKQELQSIQEGLGKDKTESNKEKKELLLAFDEKIEAISKKYEEKEKLIKEYNEKLIEEIKKSNENRITSLTDNVESLKKEYSKSFDESKNSNHNVINEIKKESEVIKTQLENERDELKKKLDQANQDHKKQIEELVSKYASFSENINSTIEQFNTDAKENQTKLAEEFNNQLKTQGEKNKALIENIQKGYEDRISQLENEYKKEIEKLTDGQQAVLEIQKELLELKQKAEARESERHEWEKNDREEKITAEKAKKEFLTKNNDDIQTIIKKLTDELEKIDFTNTDSGLTSYQTVTTNFPDWGLENPAGRQNTVMVYAMKDTRFNDNIRQPLLNQSTTNEKKEEAKRETTLTPGQCQEYLLSDIKIKSLVENFIKRFDEMKAFEEEHPEVNKLYQDNKEKIEECLNKIEGLIINLDQEKINKQNNDYFQEISKSETIKDLFINAVSRFKIEFANTVDAEAVFPFLSKEDRKKLESALKSITSENDKRGKDSIRQYRWFENYNKNMIKGLREEIQKIVTKILDQDYTVYEKYLDLDSYENAYSLVAENEKINDQNRDIVNILLQKEYDGFKAALEKEKKERDKDPHRCSLYKNNEENINAYLESLKKIVESIKQEKMAEINENQNKEYAKLIENINFEMEYNESSFIDATLSNFLIKLTEIDNLLGVLNKEEKKSIKDCYLALKKEYELRKKNPARKYQWYINSNKNSVDALAQLIGELTNKIKENSQDDSTYEIYQDVLSGALDNQNILNQIILNNQNDLDAAKLVDFLKDDLEAFQKAFNTEKESRRIEPERCFIGKKNKDKISEYNRKFNEFITNLEDEKTITQDTNKKYVDINAFLENKENRGQDFKELFFGYTSKIFLIDYQGDNAIEVYKILNFDNKKKIDDFFKHINEESNRRKDNQARGFNWYINDNKLRDSVEAMNSKIKAFGEECAKQSFGQDFEDIYLEYCRTELNNNNTVSDQSLIRLLAEHSAVDLKNSSVDNIKYHINLAEFKEVVKAEQDRRSSKPERSYYYNEKKENITKIFDAIKKYNLVLGDDKQTVSEEVNQFYRYIHSQFIFVEEVLQNKKLFLDKIRKYLDIKDYDQILFLLSHQQVQTIDMLYNKIKKEAELRKVYASRALSEENKKKLIQFREKLTQYISELSADSLIENQQAVGVLGNAIVAYGGDLLYEELFKVFGIDNGSKVSLFLDQSDKSKIESFQGLLKAAVQKVKDNQEELEREKRLLKNVFAVSQLHQPDYIIDDIREKNEIDNLQQKIIDKNDKLKELTTAHEEAIKSKQVEIDKIKQENSALFSHMKDNLAALQEKLKKAVKDFESDERKKLFFEKYLNFYIKEQEITLKYEPKEGNNTLNLLDEADLNVLFKFNLGMKSSTSKFDAKNDFWGNISNLGKLQKEQKTVVDDKEGFECSDFNQNEPRLPNIIYLIEFIIDKMKIEKVNDDSSFLRITSLYNLLSLSNYSNITKDKLYFLIAFIMEKKGKIIEYKKFNILYDGNHKAIEEIYCYSEWIRSLEGVYRDYNNTKQSPFCCQKLKRLLQDKSIVSFIDKMLQVDDLSFLSQYSDAIKKCKSLYDHIVYSHIELSYEQSKKIEIRGEDGYYEVLRNFIEREGYNVGLCGSNFKPDLFNKQNTYGALYKFFNNIDAIQPVSKIDYYFGVDKFGFDDKSIVTGQYNSCLLLEARTKELESYISKFKFYFDEHAQNSLTQGTSKMVENGKQFDEARILISEEEQKLACQKSQYEVNIKALESEIGTLEQEMQSLQEVVSKKESGKILSQKSLHDIPERMLLYLFKVQISQYIETILAMKEDELEKILTECKKTTSGKIKNTKNKKDNFELDDLFLLIPDIQKNNIQGFLEKVICSFEGIKDVNTLKQYLINISGASYDVSSDKGHFLLYGSAGTGKSQFLKVALPHYINKLQNEELKTYLKNNCHMYFIAKGDYNKEATLQGGLGNDIEKMLSVLKKDSASPMVIVVYDECDAFVVERTGGASNSGDDTNALLTLIDKSTKNPFCFAGTTNRETFDQAAVRNGRLNSVLVPMPNYNNFKVIITRYKEQYQNMINEKVIKKNQESIFQQCIENCESMLKIKPDRLKILLEGNQSGIPYIIKAIAELPSEMKELIKE